MRYYDFKKARKIILADKKAVSADIGMAQDWGRTAEEVWNKKEGFKVDLMKKGLHLGGIEGSYWATPLLKIYYKDGLLREIPCYLER